MRKVLENRNFYKESNLNRIAEFVNCYEALCSTCYDPNCLHRSWVTFIKAAGYEMNVDILDRKARVDARIEKLIEYIERVLDKS